LDSKGKDIILCINWLRKYDKVILCQKSSKVNQRKCHYGGVLCSHDYRPSQSIQSSTWEFFGGDQSNSKIPGCIPRRIARYAARS
jgi:hypothetical protein